MKIRLFKKARKDWREAKEFYEEKEDYQLSQRFSQETESALERIVQFPEAWAKIFKEKRRCLLEDFPYGIIYKIRGDELFILSTAHLRKKPGG